MIFEGLSEEGGFADQRAESVNFDLFLNESVVDRLVLSPESPYHRPFKVAVHDARLFHFIRTECLLMLG